MYDDAHSRRKFANFVRNGGGLLALVWKVTPAVKAAITNPVDRIFCYLIASRQACEPLLCATNRCSKWQTTNNLCAELKKESSVFRPLFRSICEADYCLLNFPLNFPATSFGDFIAETRGVIHFHWICSQVVAIIIAFLPPQGCSSVAIIMHSRAREEPEQCILWICEFSRADCWNGHSQFRILHALNNGYGQH